MRYFGLLFFCIITTSSFASKRPAWIFGKIENKVSNFIKVEYLDNQLNGHQDIYQMAIQFDGSFNLPIKAKFPTIVKLIYDRKEINIFVRPKEHINVTFNGANPVPSLSFDKTDKGYADNYALQKYIRDFDYLNHKNHTFVHPSLRVINTTFKKIHELSNSEGFRYIRLQHEAELKFLNSFSNLSTTFKTYLQEHIDYRWATYQIAFTKTEFLSPDLKKEFDNVLVDSLINNPAALTNAAYGSFIDQYTLWQVEEVLKKEVHYYDDWREIYKTVRDSIPNLDLKVENFFLGRLLYMNLNPKSATDVEAFLAEYMNTEKTRDFLPTLRERFAYAKRFANGSMAPNFSLVDVNGVQVSSEDLRGKVIYLTFWANWCERCIEEMNASAHLLDKYKEEDIVFLYVSLETNQSAWKNHYLLKKVKGLHLWGEGTKSEIAKRYEIFSLPRHFMIDKRGKFITPFHLIEDDDFDTYIRGILGSY